MSFAAIACRAHQSSPPNINDVNNPATAYYEISGNYVVVDNITNALKEYRIENSCLQFVNKSHISVRNPYISLHKPLYEVPIQVHIYEKQTYVLDIVL